MVKRVLILTNSADATADYLHSRLEDAGICPARYDTDTDLSCTRFAYRDSGPQISWREHLLAPDQIGAVVLRRPKPLKPPVQGDQFRTQHIAREWSEVWEGFLAHLPDSCWINHPGQNFKASHKIEQLTRAKKFGFQIPATLVTNDPEAARLFVQSQPAGTIVKPLASGYIERRAPSDDTIIYTHEFLAEHHFLIESIEPCPILFQERIQKEIDIRMTVVDDEIIAVGIKAREGNGDQRLDVRRNNMSDVSYGLIEIPDSISILVRRLLRSYGLRFAALDFAISADSSWVFFEINPNGQWAWLDIDAGTNISDFFVKSLRRDIGE
jgi:glutathione synthase/RimK-type ligase-like ATP-grasp enzyme